VGEASECAARASSPSRLLGPSPLSVQAALTPAPQVQQRQQQPALCWGPLRAGGYATPAIPSLRCLAAMVRLHEDRQRGEGCDSCVAAGTPDRPGSRLSSAKSTAARLRSLCARHHVSAPPPHTTDGSRGDGTCR